MDVDKETVRIEAANVAMKNEDVATRRVRVVGFVRIRHIVACSSLFLNVIRLNRLPRVKSKRLLMKGGEFCQGIVDR